VGGFVTLLVTRWYQRRLYYIALIGNLKALLVIAEGFVAVPHTEISSSSSSFTARAKAASDARRTVARYVVLAFELAMLKQRGHIDTILGREFLEQEQLLLPRSRPIPSQYPPPHHAQHQHQHQHQQHTPHHDHVTSSSSSSSGDDDVDEWSLMVPGARHLTVLSWLATLFRKCRHAGLLPDGALPELCHLLERARSNSSDMMDRTIYDLPFAYTHLVTILVKLTVIFNAMLMGTCLVGAVHDDDDDVEGLQKNPILLVMVVTLVILLNCGFQGLLDLQPLLQNPFGYSGNDIPHEHLSGTLRTLARGLADGADENELGFDGTWAPKQEGFVGSRSSSLGAGGSEEPAIRSDRDVLKHHQNTC
jgi:hypothetical protein